MTLLQTVKDITKQNPTEEEAMCYARDNFGILAAYIKDPKRREKEVLMGALNTIRTLTNVPNDERLMFLHNYINSTLKTLELC